MAQDSLPKVIRANSWRLLVVSTLLLAVITGLGVRFGSSMLKSVRGPVRLSAVEFVRRLDAHQLDGELVDVTGSASVDSGLHHQFAADGSQKTVDSISFLTIGDRLVPVRTAQPTTETHFVGVVGVLDADLAKKVDARLAQEAAGGTRLSPLAIDAAVDHELLGKVGAALLALAFVVSAGMWLVNLVTLLAPRTSRAARRVRSLHGRDAIAAASAQLSQTHLCYGRLHITRRWLVGVQINDRVVARPMHDLVWCYRKVPPSRLLGPLSIGRRHVIVMVWADGKRSSFGLDDEAALSTVTAAITKFAPWAASGYTKELQTMWSKHRDELLESVKARRARLEQFNMVAESAGVVWNAPQEARTAVPDEKTNLAEFIPLAWESAAPAPGIAQSTRTPLPTPAPALITMPTPTPVRPTEIETPETAPEIASGPILIFEPLPMAGEAQF